MDARTAVMQYMCPALGVVIAFCMFISPLPAVLRVDKKKELGVSGKAVVMLTGQSAGAAVDGFIGKHPARNQPISAMYAPEMLRISAAWVAQTPQGLCVSAVLQYALINSRTVWHASIISFSLPSLPCNSLYQPTSSHDA